MVDVGPEILCEARGVSHEFKLPDGRSRSILKQIDLVIHPREVVALLGPSGCGKSTLLRICAGLLLPTAGAVTCRGQPLTGLSPGVAFVFQSFALFPWLTVRQNVEVVLSAAGRPAEAIRRRADEVLAAVGLAPFVDAFPRELSGGMKQRVGIARAVAVEPELLFMDEPFSQVDALTAETMRAEVIDLWSSASHIPSSIVLVSHDIKEVVYMADRVVVLSANPGRILRIVANPLPRPRDYRSESFLRLVDELHDIITGHEMPDLPPSPSTAFEPLPEASPGEVIGLLEYLDARSGQEDIFRIASETNREFGRVIVVAKACEVLDFVDTPKRLVRLSPDGRGFVAADTAGRRAIWRDKLMEQRFFRDVHALIERQPNRRVNSELLQEIMAMNMPQENLATMFETFVRWARYCDFLIYDAAAEVFVLPEARPAARP